MRRSVRSVYAMPVAVVTGLGFAVLPVSPAGAGPVADGLATIDPADLSLPPLPVEMVNFRNDLFTAYGNDPDFGLTEVSLDRTEFTVHWYGDVPTFLTEAAQAVESFELTVEPTPLQPGMLSEVAEQIVMDPSLAGIVTSAAPRVDGDGVDVFSNPDAPADVVAAALAETDVPVPVTIEESAAPQAVAPGWRWDDQAPHWAGSSMRKRTGGGCTSAFSVRRNSDGAGGMLTASHCGGVNDVWDAYNAPNTNYFGTIVQENDSRDAAILSGSTYTRGIYTGPYNTSPGGALSAYLSVLSVGDEICFSGSYSGWNCGNIINTPSETYNPVDANGQPVLTQPATGARSYKIGGGPAVGNGDSGGPGIVAYQDGEFVGVAAATIISAITGGTPTCSGVAGSSAPGGRKCSPNVLSTNAYAAATNMGWSLLGV